MLRSIVTTLAATALVTTLGQITLQPVSVEGSVGSNVAAGVAAVELKYAK